MEETTAVTPHPSRAIVVVATEGHISHLKLEVHTWCLNRKFLYGDSARDRFATQVGPQEDYAILILKKHSQPRGSEACQWIWK